MTEDQSILSKLTDIEKTREALISQARTRQDEILAELAGLCSPKLLGPLTRAKIPDGILKRRERKAPKVVKGLRARAKAAEPKGDKEPQP